MNTFQEQCLLKILKENGYSICFSNEIPDVSLITKRWFNSNVLVKGKQLTFDTFVSICLQAKLDAEKNLYKEQRIKEYPQIEDQLDMLYWDMINGTSNWKDYITKIKEKYPKS